jgi:uncharacterized phage protein gp47/JayE
LENAYYLGSHDFGETIRVSQIIATIQAVPGVSYVNMATPVSDIAIPIGSIAAFSNIMVNIAGEV